MKKTIIIGLMILLLINSVFASEELLNELNDNMGNIEGQELPGFSKTLFGDERINLEIGNLILGIVTKEGEFVSVSQEKLENPTINAKTDQETIVRIKTSNSPLAAFRNALNEDKVTYSAVGLGNKIKMGFLSFFVRIAGWFADDEEVPTETEVEEETLTETEETQLTCEDKEFNTCYDSAYDLDGDCHMTEDTLISMCPDLTEDYVFDCNDNDSEVWEVCETGETEVAVDSIEGENNEETPEIEETQLTCEDEEFNTCYDSAYDLDGDCHMTEDTLMSMCPDLAEDYVFDCDDNDAELITGCPNTTHDVKIDLTEFNPDEITINVGDTITWTNVREGNLHLAMVVGTQQCTSIKSEMLDTGDTFSWTFEEVETCTFVDAITTTQIMKVYVE